TQKQGLALVRDASLKPSELIQSKSRSVRGAFMHAFSYLLLGWALVGGVAHGCTLEAENIYVYDYTPAGTVVMPVIVKSPDTLDHAATSIDTQNAGMPLEVLSNNSLLLKSPMTGVKVLRITCGDGEKKLLIVNMIDTDNNAPVWDSWNYTYSVRETEPVPYELKVKPKATDEPDKNSGQRLEYSILPSEYSSYFSLLNPSQSVMNISLIKQLDYETVQQVVLILKVSDYNTTGQKVFEVNTTLTVNIINEDDTNPVWLNCTAGAPSGVCYVRELLSNSTSGTLISPPIKAVDGDIGLNAAIFYTIVSQSPSNIVNIDNATGALSLITNLPDSERYSIVLFATQANNGDRKTNTELQLNIVAASYTPPVFDSTLYNVTVMENNPQGLVVVVKTIDHLRRSVTYHLSGFLDVFSIGASTGELRAIKSLDYESKSSYTLNVSASDGTGWGFTTVLVLVGNDNEYNPTFDSAEYTFAAAKRENGLEVGRVSAVDGDGSTVTFSIMDTDYRKLFAVDAKLGIITINTIPANLAEKSYRFSVTASDGSRTSSVTVIVNFDSALINVANASVSTIPLIVLGCVFAVIIISVIVAFLLYRRYSAKQADSETGPPDGSELPDSYDYHDMNEFGGTSLQDNPLDGYNNYMFGDQAGSDVGSFNRERDQGELFVSNGVYQLGSANDYYSSMTNGSIHTVSGEGSLVGSQRTLVHSSRPRQLHAGSNLNVVQVENAVDAASDLPNSQGDQLGRNGGPGLTVYF
ncbi:hypothetical protein BOX15_Mlig004140g4, partial [Macrostomum lignano]